MSDEPSAESFKRLLDDARSGDRDAWQQIFDRLANQEKEGADFLAIARKLLPANDRAREFVDSRDLMQSALRDGWLDASQFSGKTEGEFFSWMRTIVRRKIGRQVRKKRPQVGLEGEGEAAPSPAESDEGPLDRMVRREMTTRLREAIDKLPDDQREVIRMRLKGMKSPDIGAELGLSPEAVRMREMRAARRLREILKGEDAS